jgi:hypothetical protein
MTMRALEDYECELVAGGRGNPHRPPAPAPVLPHWYIENPVGFVDVSTATSTYHAASASDFNAMTGAQQAALLSSFA